MNILAAALSCHLSEGCMSKPDILHLPYYRHLLAFVIASCVKFYGIFSKRNTSETNCGMVNK